MFEPTITNDAEGSCNGPVQWWDDKDNLTPECLKKHENSWSLADDAATATILQNISQKLVAKTHEVEGLLEKVFEESERLSIAISNTNNSFLMLANTQFIENRTYQDEDEHLVEADESTVDKSISEEDLLKRQKQIFESSLSLFHESYERHDIQDSDTEDEDSGSPIYTMIDPYQDRKLPHIIGTKEFMEDDRVGLEFSTSPSEGNSPTFASDTDADGESADEIDNSRQFLSTSSRIQESESSSSDWCEDDRKSNAKLYSNNNSGKTPKHDSEDDDDDDIFFKPNSNHGNELLKPPISDPVSELRQKLQQNVSTPTNRDIASDSDSESEKFFRRKSSSILPTKGNLFDNNNSSDDQDSLFAPDSRKDKQKNLNNVRAMPDPVLNKPEAIKRKAKISSSTTKPKNELFGSDSNEDDGGLFKPKSHSGLFEKSSPINLESSSRSDSVTTNTKVPVKQSLFSSDSNEDEFFNESINPVENVNVSTKEVSKKKPPGGVNIFSSAINAAIRKQTVSDSGHSDNLDWDDKNEPSIEKETKPPSNVTNIESSKSSKGIFDDSDDDDFLFGANIKPRVGGKTNKKDLEDAQTLEINKENPSNDSLSSKKNVASNVNPHTSSKINKPSLGIFSSQSSDDDDLFAIPKNSSIKESSNITNHVSSPSANTPKPEDKIVSGSEKFTITNTSTPKQKLLQDDNIFSPPPLPSEEKIKSSLFSSGSSDDDLFGTTANKNTDLFSNKNDDESTEDNHSSQVISVNNNPKSNDNDQLSNVATTSDSTKSSSQIKVYKKDSLSDSDGFFGEITKKTSITSQDDTSENENKASSPKKKPVGGVALFGGNELFAKINKRKTLLNESDDEEEVKVQKKYTDTEPTGSDGVNKRESVSKNKEKDISKRKDLLFNQPPSTTANVVETQNKSDKKIFSVFSSDSSDDEDLFGSIVESIQSVENKTDKKIDDKKSLKNIFSSDDSEEDIFSDVKKIESDKILKKDFVSKSQKNLTSSNDNIDGALHSKKKKISPQKVQSKEPNRSNVETFKVTKKLSENDEQIKNSNENENIINDSNANIKEKKEFPLLDSLLSNARKDNESNNNQNQTEKNTKDKSVNINEIKQKSFNEEIGSEAIDHKEDKPISGVSLFGKDDNFTNNSKMTSSVAFQDDMMENSKKENEEIKNSISKKKPIGGVSMFGSDDLLAQISRRTSSIASQEDPSENSNQENDTNENKASSPKKKPVGGVALFANKELFAKINKRKTLMNQSDDEEDQVKISDTEKVLEPDEDDTISYAPKSPSFGSIFLKQKSNEGETLPPISSESTISFDSPVNSTTLESVNKARPKMLNKRPPSKKWRKSTARNSQTEESVNEIKTSDESIMPSSTIEAVDSPGIEPLVFSKETEGGFVCPSSITKVDSPDIDPLVLSKETEGSVVCPSSITKVEEGAQSINYASKLPLSIDDIISDGTSILPTNQNKFDIFNDDDDITNDYLNKTKHIETNDDDDITNDYLNKTKHIETNDTKKVSSIDKTISPTSTNLFDSSPEGNALFLPRPKSRSSSKTGKNPIEASSDKSTRTGTLKVKSHTVTASIFGDDNDDDADDLFGPAVTMSKSTLFDVVNENKPPTIKGKKNLFSDDEEDGDIFKSSRTSSNASSMNFPTESVARGTLTATSEPFIDPLMGDSKQ